MPEYQRKPETIEIIDPAETSLKTLTARTGIQGKTKQALTLDTTFGIKLPITENHVIAVDSRGRQRRITREELAEQWEPIK